MDIGSKILRHSALLGCVALLSCGGGSKTELVSDFSLASAPTTVTLVPGGTSQQIDVSASPTNGFAGAVAVTISGLPAGVSAQPSMLTLTPGAAQPITLTAATTAAAGTATLTLTGTSGMLSHTTMVTLTVAPAPDFSLTVSPPTLTLTPGAAGSQISISSTAINSFTGTVAVAISGLPAGVTANQSTLNLTPGTPQNITLTAAAGASASTATVNFTGTSGTLIHSATLALAVSSLPDFTLTLSLTSLTIVAGAAGSPVNVTATALNSFSGVITVAVTGLPAGATASPATLALAPGTPQSTTLTAALTAPSASANVTFKGTSGTLSHSTPLPLTVQAAVDDQCARRNHLPLQRSPRWPERKRNDPHPGQRQLHSVRQDWFLCG